MERVALPGCFKRLLGGERSAGSRFYSTKWWRDQTFPHKSKESLDQRPIIRPLIDLDELQNRIGLLKVKTANLYYCVCREEVASLHVEFDSTRTGKRNAISQIQLVKGGRPWSTCHVPPAGCLDQLHPTHKI